MNKEVILSTGMSDLKEIGDALKILINAGTPKEKYNSFACKYYVSNSYEGC